jgi:hypothetical protein
LQLSLRHAFELMPLMINADLSIKIKKRTSAKYTQLAIQANGK